MPRPSTARAQLLEAAGTTPLQARSHYAEWLAQSLVTEHLRAEELMGFSGPTGPYGEAGSLPPAEYLPESHTAVYSLAAEGEAINPTAAELKDVAHRLIGTGLADERSLEGLSFRVTNLQEPTPDWLRQAEADHAHYRPVENDMTQIEQRTGRLAEFSFSYKTFLNVDEAQAAQFPVQSVDQTTAVFLHELAHAQHDMHGADLPHELAQAMRGVQTWRDEEQGADAAKSVGGWVLEQERAAVPFLEKNDWSRAADEAYADTYMVVAVHALHGKEAALDTLASLQSYRSQELADALEQMPLNAWVVEGHHTSEALESLRGFIEDGSVERALAEGRGRDPVILATAEGLLREYEAVRTADLNPHTMGQDGALYAGWPIDLPTGEVLAALHAESGEVKLGAMVVMTEAQYAQMQTQDEDLRAVSPSGESSEMQAQPLPGAPGYVFLATDHLALEHQTREGAQHYELQSGAQNLREDLAERFGVDLASAQNGYENSHSGVSSSHGSGGGSPGGSGGMEQGDAEVSREAREAQGVEREERAAQAEAQAEAEMEM